MAEPQFYTLGGITRMTGQKARTVQFWGDGGVLLPLVGTDRGGAGVHRVFDRIEAIIACILTPFAAHQIPVGELRIIAKTLRDQLRSGDSALSIVEDVIRNKISGYLVFARKPDGASACKIFDIPPDESFEQKTARLGLHVMDTLEKETVKGSNVAKADVIHLNPCFAGFRKFQDKVAL